MVIHYQTVNQDEIGPGLEIANAKLGVKIDTAADNLITVTDEGLKAVAPAAPDVPVAYTGSSVEDRTITFNKSDGNTDTLELPAAPVDVHLANATVNEETGALTLTMSDGNTHTTNITGEVFAKILEGSSDAAKKRIAKALAQPILDLIMGNAYDKLDGSLMGYFLTGTVADA